MKTIVSRTYETALVTVESPPLAAEAGKVVIDVRAIGVGRVDLIMRQMMASPFVPGIEVVGIVVETGTGVDRAWVGRSVFARVSSGGYAEQVLADSATLVALPDGLAFEAAIAAGVNALVAHFCVEKGRIGRGETVVVRGARGGIGHLAVQIARRLGGSVMSDTTSCEPIAADVIIDLVAGPQTGAHLAMLHTNGRYVLAGITAGMPPADFANVLLTDFRRSLSITTLSLDSLSNADINIAASNLFTEVFNGHVCPKVAETLPLEEADYAHELLTGRRLSGKIVLVP